MYNTPLKFLCMFMHLYVFAFSNLMVLLEKVCCALLLPYALLTLYVNTVNTDEVL
jgi:hypothetical protein